MSFSHKNGDSEVTGDFSRLNKLIENLSKDYYVDIGILGDTNETVEGGYTLAGIGAVHEFGTDKAGRGNNVVIPERSFIRMPLEQGQEEIEKSLEPRLKKLLEKGDIETIFKLIGIAGEAQIHESFASAGFGQWPPLAESTIAQRKNGSSEPLRDTGAMEQAITSKVGK